VLLCVGTTTNDFKPHNPNHFVNLLTCFDAHAFVGHLAFDSDETSADRSQNISLFGNKVQSILLLRLFR
jgi:hypothetical protein